MTAFIITMTLALGILFSGFVRKMAPTLRSALYAFQGLTALGIASLLFFLAPWGLSLIDPTAGSYDFGVITRALAGAAVFFLGTFCVWLSMWLDWPDVLKWADEDKENPKGKVGAGLKDAWGKFPDKHKIWFLLALFFGLLAFFSTCVFLIPA